MLYCFFLIMEFTLVKGCIPCAFVCNCCKIMLFRCSNGDKMYQLKTMESKKNYCSECYYHITHGMSCTVYEISK